ncbi:unnamed protein product [Amoebophrya sp. A120]|nr:unnamed protein product [Amoebophrya sp. A120]|eukprot:GSA120T00024656001.1
MASHLASSSSSATGPAHQHSDQSCPSSGMPEEAFVPSVDLPPSSLENQMVEKIHLPQAIEEYSEHIFKRLFAVEEESPDSQRKRHPQSEVKEKMRAILVDWLVEVHNKFKLMAETLYLTVDILDRYLAKAPVERQKLQQVGVTCLFIASKYEEIHPPEIRDLVYITDHSSSRNDILDTEIAILNTLNFDISGPTIYHYVAYYAHLAYPYPQSMWPQEQLKAFNLACYTLEMCLLDSRTLHKHPFSKLAAAALFMSKKILRVSPSWPPPLIARTPYCPQNLKACAKELVPLVTSHGQNLIDPKLKSVKQKYATEDKMELSSIYFHM